eukprot:1103038-Prymnesium_polylepis.2
MRRPAGWPGYRQISAPRAANCYLVDTDSDADGLDASTGLGGSLRKQLLRTTSWSRAANTELRSMASRACVPPCDCEAPLFT